jgi:hypothetical protein
MACETWWSHILCTKYTKHFYIEKIWKVKKSENKKNTRLLRKRSIQYTSFIGLPNQVIKIKTMHNLIAHQVTRMKTNWQHLKVSRGETMTDVQNITYRLRTQMFDKIGLLSMGELVYFGKSTQMVEYFQDVGYPCPTYASPLDHYGESY